MTRIVSIAMATRNAGVHLAAQLESLLRQTYSPLEIVISDDSSDDGTYETLLEYAASDSRIRLLPKGPALGLNGNFLRCFRACRGDLISPCDQDDVWDPEKTAKLAAACIGHGLSYCDSRLVDEHGTAFSGRRTKISDTVAMADNPPLLGLLMNNCVAGHAMMFPRELLDQITEVPPYSYFDWWLVLLARGRNHTLRYVDEPLVLYRRHCQAATSVSTATHAERKVRSLKSHYATAHALSRTLGTSCPIPVDQYLNAFEHWLKSWVAFSAFRFFWRNRDNIFMTKAHRRRPMLGALRYLFGYQLKHFLRPSRYPSVRAIDNGALSFETRSASEKQESRDVICLFL